MIPLRERFCEVKEGGNGAGAFGAEPEIAGDNMLKNPVEMKV